MNLEAEIDELLREAGWAGMSWDALSTKYRNVAATGALDRALNRLIARKSIYRFLRPHGIGRIRRGVSTIYYSYWPATAADARTRHSEIAS
jgi:hypothetical protein